MEFSNDSIFVNFYFWKAEITLTRPRFFIFLYLIPVGDKYIIIPVEWECKENETIGFTEIKSHLSLFNFFKFGKIV